MIAWLGALAGVVVLTGNGSAGTIAGVRLQAATTDDETVRDFKAGRTVKNQEALANSEVLRLYEDLPELRAE